MARKLLFAAELFLWLYASILLFNSLWHPSSWNTYLRVENIGVSPHLIISETFLRHEPESPTQWLRIPPPWMMGPLYFVPNWHDQLGIGGGPMNHFSEQISKVNIPRVVLRFLLTSAIAAVLIVALRTSRNRLPKPKGFEVLPIAPPSQK